MAVSLNKNFLLDVIQKTFPVIPNRTSLQVLSNFKIVVQDGVLSITASDLDNFVLAKTTVDGDDSFEIAVNARKLFDIVRELDNALVTLEVKENMFYITSETGFACSLSGVDLIEFPNFPDNGYGEVKTISVELFKNLVEKSSFAVSRDESRASLCGVLWEQKDGQMDMIATDGHRLGLSYIQSEGEDFSVIVSPKSLNHVVKTAENVGIEEIQFSFNEKQVIFTVDTFILNTKLIDGPYPDYNKGIPKEFSKTAVIDREELISIVRRVAIFTNKKTNLIKFTFNENELSVSASNRDILAEATQTVSVEYEGDSAITLGFNHFFLTEILNIIKTPKVTFKLNAEVSAVIILPVEESSVSEDIYLLMPLRIFE